MRAGRLPPHGTVRPLIVALTLALLTVAPLHGLAQEEAAPPSKPDKIRALLEKLKEKGLISEEEFAELADETPEARAEARAERRRKAQQEAQAASREEAKKDQFTGRWNNGIVFQTGDQRTSWGLSGRVHADYRYFDGDTAASTFDVRRAYLTLSGRYNDWLTWDVTGDFAQTGTTLDVAWVNAAFSDALQVRLGQFKMPFALEELTSSRFLDFQERSFVDRLAPAKERGAMIHGSPYLGTTYALALSNGQGKNNNEVSPKYDTPDLVGRATLNVAELLNAQAKAVYHIGAAFSYGELSTSTTTNSGTAAIGNQNSEPRGATFFTPTAFNGPSTTRRRVGLETALAYGPVKFQAEYAQANFNGSTSTGTPYDKDIDAYYLSALWMITGERYAESYRNGVFGRIVPIQNFVPGTGGTGAWELGLRFSGFDAGDFPLVAATGPTAAGGLGGTSVGSLTSPTATNGAKAVTVGLKWIWNPNFKWYLNYTDTKYDNAITFTTAGVPVPFQENRERAVTLRAAFDF
ncbi:MAG: hypothetical protein KIT73_09140 [Burkholderiales bacterium]|nr:hypothetical protein [Burkholderiales bacterium]